ncbi:MFS transporter [Horticoccus sp. 23ND18S-11]|uniref:MFS transporter n=1 Tax=Horticoccus sp. 23ND18S-11 TaxID=3391832 RepID=UPI0039C8F9D9
MSQPNVAPAAPAREATRLSELSPLQWKSGIAAWLGWTFDGLELHLYTLVAGPLVMQLLHTTDASNPAVNEKKAYIQAAFLIGWALGGAFFGRIGDLLGRSRALTLTIITYALCTGLCSFAETWWQLMIFRFVAALGIGGEWAVGASLLSETWPKAWRPWMAAVLQTGVNVGVLGGAVFVGLLMTYMPAGSERWVFLIGVLPALLVFWIRKHVPEPATWEQAGHTVKKKPGALALFRGEVLSTTLRTTLVCALGLSAWWLFLFWQTQHLRKVLADAHTPAAEVTALVSAAFFAFNAASVLGNFGAAWLARRLGNRRAIVIMFIGLAGGIFASYIVPRGFGALAWFWLPVGGFFGGVFGLFTMYLPPLFPTLIRTTGAGFCYNIGRIAAAVASIVFGLVAPVDDFRNALLCVSAIAAAAAISSWWLPERTHENEAT